MQWADILLSDAWLLTVNAASDLENLRLCVKSDGRDNPCQAGLRSLVWKAVYQSTSMESLLISCQIFLCFHTADQQAWSKQTAKFRDDYSALRTKYFYYIDNPDLSGSSFHPLSDDENVCRFHVRSSLSIDASVSLE
jgi:hypothetical protein